MNLNQIIVWFHLKVIYQTILVQTEFFLFRNEKRISPTYKPDLLLRLLS